MNVDWTGVNSGRRWKDSSGSFKCETDGTITDLSGQYLGERYYLHRGIIVEYGYWRRPRKNAPHEWTYSYAIYCDRKEIKFRTSPERRWKKRRVPWRLGRRIWVLVNDKMGYITASRTLAPLRETRDRLHMEIATRLMTDLPAIDMQKRRLWG